MVCGRLYRRHRHVLARHSGHDDRPGRVPAVLHVAHGFPGSCVKLAYDKWAAHRDAEAGLSDEEKAAKDAAFQEQGLVVASGLLGGESIVGVILAFVSVA